LRGGNGLFRFDRHRQRAAAAAMAEVISCPPDEPGIDAATVPAHTRSQYVVRV
jgi:hypothetical protein